MDLSIQFLEEINVRLYNTYVIGNKLFIFNPEIRYETYQNEWYYGIIFFIEGEGDDLICKDGRYDVVHHYHMDWERLLINNKDGWKDLPFHNGTFRFLPDQIKVLEL